MQFHQTNYYFLTTIYVNIVQIYNKIPNRINIMFTHQFSSFPVFLLLLVICLLRCLLISSFSSSAFSFICNVFNFFSDLLVYLHVFSSLLIYLFSNSIYFHVSFFFFSLSIVSYFAT